MEEKKYEATIGGGMSWGASSEILKRIIQKTNTGIIVSCKLKHENVPK